jgi:hypothetical protein
LQKPPCEAKVCAFQIAQSSTIGFIDLNAPFAITARHTKDRNMTASLTQAFQNNFLGNSPSWYQKLILAFLVINPILLMVTSPFIVGWVLIAQFILTLAMALKCYPLQPGGL